MSVTIDPEFKALIPPLTPEEREQLEKNLVADGCRDSLVVWAEGGNLLMDGHNRFEICTARNIPFDVVPVATRIASREEAKVWLIRNQFGRRNLQPFQRCELALQLEPLISNKAKENQRGGQGGVLLSQKSVEAKSDTQKELAKVAGVSHDTIHKAKKISEKADEGTKVRLRTGETTINAAYNDIKREEKREEIKAQLDDVAAREVEQPTGKFDVIVIDPPWPMQKIERDVRPNQSEMDYPVMSEDELLEWSEPAERAADDCHVFLWTTHKFLPLALALAAKWNFKYTAAFVWHKAGGFQPVGLPQYNCEFALYVRKGNPQFLDTKNFPLCFNGERGAHSEKPEEFYETLRRVTGGRRLDMFNRRAIEGFSGWGKESK